MKQIFICILSLLSFLNIPPVSAGNQEKTRKYAYEDTKRLVALVQDAASLIEKKGRDAFKEFSIRGSKWLTDKHYLFVYDAGGTCVFHPVQPDLMGQNLKHFKDMEGKAVIALIVDVGKKPRPDASGWVFYLWEGPHHTYPVRKGSYIRKALAPDGKIYLVGSGLYNMKIEEVFIEENVDKAAELIRRKGKEAAFRELRDHSCPLNVLDSYIEVIDAQGNVIVDPMYPHLKRKRNISLQRDYIGRYLFTEIKNALAHKDRSWIFYIKPNIKSGRPEKHLMYIRKLKMGNEIFYVAANFVPAAPIWMK